jgi:hypothetical protein
MDELVRTLYANRDLKRTTGMAAYMKGQFLFLGIAKPLRMDTVDIMAGRSSLS